MRLDITRGIQRKGVDQPFTLEEAWGEDQWAGDTVVFKCPVSVSGTYLLADETVILRGTARAVVEAPCARCLAPTEIVLQAELEEAFVRDKGEPLSADVDQYMYSGHILELDEAVRCALLLEMPSRVLCREDCRGLCDRCGINLNISECSCQKDLTSRNPFSALASLLNKDEEV